MAPENWTAIAVALLALAGVGWQAYSGKRKGDADAASTLTGAALGMVNELQEQLKAARGDIEMMRQAQDAQRLVILGLRDRIAILEKENEELKRENAHLRREFERATGIKPDTGPLRDRGGYDDK